MDAIMWLRRDLRLVDNHALYEALSRHGQVQLVFIFDLDILSKLEDRADPRVSFIHKRLQEIKNEIEPFGMKLWTFHGAALDVFKKMSKSHSFEHVYANHDYEPEAIHRDQKVGDWLMSNGISLHTFKDQVVFEKGEISKNDGLPYTVFTPYSKKWKALYSEDLVQSYPSEDLLHHMNKSQEDHWLELKDIGFKKTNVNFPEPSVTPQLLKSYQALRDYPAQNGTSHLSVHLRFGTLSIRKLTVFALKHSETWLNELIWREFYQMIIWHFPQSVEKPFKLKYEGIEWRHDERDFEKWCKGETGYPLVDAGMRELNTTGFMHNRVRMVVASFLCKHLLLPWKWGERYFASKLLDFDLASNVGGWQWAAGTGCDAAPYFRVFNPELQWKKFDPDSQYVKKWVPEYQDPFAYSEPMVEHKMARERAIDRYKTGLAAYTI